MGGYDSVAVRVDGYNGIIRVNIIIFAFAGNFVRTRYLPLAKIHNVIRF
jgi:hypothetical protein